MARRGREGTRISQPTEHLASPKPRDHHPTRGTSARCPTGQSQELSAGRLRRVPTHRLDRALLMGDLLGAPEVDADFACLTPQALLGVSWEEFEFGRRC